nr:uncharacterized protein LOC119178261 isoform X2 [Rhipicephalus microplus]
MFSANICAVHESTNTIMKVFIFLVLLAITTSFDAAIIQEAGGIEGETLNHGLEPIAMKKAGQTMKSLGKILQGDLSSSTIEEREKLFSDIKTLMLAGKPEEGTEEYFIMLVVKAIAIGALTGGLSAGVKHLVERNQKKREG